MFPTIAAISSNFRGALSAKRLQAISVFFGKLKESKAPETTSETEGLRKLEELSPIKRSLQRLRDTRGNLKKLEAA